MMRVAVVATTDGAGAATAYTGNVAGEVRQVRYVADGTAAYDNTADITITDEVTGAAVLTITNLAATTTWLPRVATVDATGTAALYAAGGTAVGAPPCVGYGRIKVVVAQGGASKTGTFHFWVVD